MEARRCHIHGLVVQADGRCVICRRTRGEAAKPDARAAEPASSGGGGGAATALVLLIAAFALVVTGGYLYKRSRDTAAAEAAAVAEDTEEDVATEEPEPAGATTPLMRRPKGGRPAFPSADEEPVEATVTASATDASAEEARLSAAMKSVRITMYSTQSCGYCKRARKWLGDNGYSFTDLDVETSETDSIVHRSLNPSGSVPTFDVGGVVVIGFDSGSLEASIRSVAQKSVPQGSPK